MQAGARKPVSKPLKTGRFRPRLAWNGPTPPARRAWLPAWQFRDFPELCKLRRSEISGSRSSEAGGSGELGKARGGSIPTGSSCLDDKVPSFERRHHSVAEQIDRVQRFRERHVAEGEPRRPIIRAGGLDVGGDEVAHGRWRTGDSYTQSRKFLEGVRDKARRRAAPSRGARTARRNSCASADRRAARWRARLRPCRPQRHAGRRRKASSHPCRGASAPTGNARRSVAPRGVAPAK